VALDRAALSAVAHAAHPVAAPVHDDAVERLLRALPVADGGTVVDVGCGSGQWLVRLLSARPGLTGVGLDVSAPALAVAAESARAAGAVDRVEWREADAGEALEAPVDAGLCVGSTHAFGGLSGTLTAMRERVRPGGSLLLGDGFWEVPPSQRARAVIGELPDLAGVVAACRDAGWSVLEGHVSTADEWDAYEWSWAGSLTRWALERPGTPEAEQALALAREHQDEWLQGYRGQLGFVTLVLVRG
jgi:SAM-dependent methyltransferase